ncbi:TlpA family protein disulfide reductase [Nocardioides sp. CPCC 205120]|uniref:TlpA family protein disulfide reductase n=1 Tax=Nocardioides sp. CPCC 205120 TaxID=3406462 RepID=UPI003B50D3F0
MTGLWILLAAVVLAGGLGLWRLRTDGRFRGAASPAGTAEPATGPLETPPEQNPLEEDPVTQTPASEPTAPAEPGAWARAAAAGVPGEPGERATLLQFSSAFCAPCRATRRVLGEVAELVPGVAHVEVDAEHHLQLVRDLDVRRTPTTLVLDAAGREVTRAAGAPTKQQVLAGLEAAL